MQQVSLLKVSAKSNPNAVAGAIAGIIRQHGFIDIQVIGAGALNQAVKAIAIARGFVSAGGIELVAIPTFHDVEVEGDNRTAIRLRVEDRNVRPVSSSITVELEGDLKIEAVTPELQS